MENIVSGKVSPRHSFHYYATWLIVIAVAAIAVYFGLYIYQANQKLDQVDQLARALHQADADDAAARAADTVGGKTPQETLQLYIDAVEQGDFELASKYFVVEGQQKELDSLRRAPKENIANMIVLLKQVKEEDGSYSNDGVRYGFLKPVYIEFFLYPSKVWKIVEI